MGRRVLSLKTCGPGPLGESSHMEHFNGSAVNQKHRVFNIEAFPIVAQL